MNAAYILSQLDSNAGVFNEILKNIPAELITWKVQPEKWCLLEIVCHLHDEEREDFRARLRHVLETPNDPLPSIDPVGWVAERNYIGQDFHTQLKKFSQEREESVRWLKSLVNPNYENAFQHPKFGPLSGRLFMSNWLAHDYLHIRQITKVKYDYLAKVSGETLDYAGTW